MSFRCRSRPHNIFFWHGGRPNLCNKGQGQGQGKERKGKERKGKERKGKEGESKDSLV